MKGKKIALLMAALSVASMFAACDGSAAAPCSKHVDSDKNLVCDSCQRAIVYVTEYLPAEEAEETPMVVNPLPTENNRADYYLHQKPTAKYTKENVNFDKDFITANKWTNGGLYGKQWTVTDDTDPENVTKKDVYKVWDKNGNVLATWESDVYKDGETPKKAYTGTRTISGVWIFQIHTTELVKNEEDVEVSVTKVYYYSYDGKFLFMNEGGAADYNSVPERVNGVIYQTFTLSDDTQKVVAIDSTTYKLLHVFEKDEPVIARPAYTVQTETYGALYEEGNNKLWIHSFDGACLKLTYAKVLPSYVSNVRLFPLQDGKLLMQGYKQLSPDAVNYDIGGDTVKYDVFQTIIDPATGEEKDVEFGYQIAMMYTATAELGYTDKAKNVAMIMPIEDKAVSGETLNVILDNELNILYVEQKTLIGQGNVEKQVGEDLYLSSLTYDNGSSVRILVNGKGELVKYLPEAYEDKGNYLQVGTKLYAWNDLENAKLDLADYSEVQTLSYGFVLTKEIQPTEPEGEVTYEYYYFNSATLTLSKKFAVKPSAQGGGLLIVKETIPAQGETPETVKSTVYNANLEVLFEGEGVAAYLFDSTGAWLRVDGVKIAKLPN